MLDPSTQNLGDPLAVHCLKRGVDSAMRKCATIMCRDAHETILEWDDLRYVLATVRSGSFFGASKLLKVSHTTVSRRVQSLEDELGKPLFVRTRGGCQPTDAAGRLMPIAERVEREIRDVGRLAMDTSETPRGLVEVHTASWILKRILIPALPAFYAQHPQVQLYFVSDVVEPPQTHVTPIITLRFSIMAKRTEIETKLADIDYSVYARRGRDPSKLKWVSTFGGSIVLSTYSWLRDNDIEQAEVPFLTADSDLAAEAIVSGDFKGLIPDLIGLRENKMVRMTDGPPDLTRPLRAIVSRRYVGRPEVKAVSAWLDQTISSAAAQQ